MATKSILNNVEINTNDKGKLLLSALTKSETTKNTFAKSPIECNDLNQDDIKSFFTK